MRAISDEKNISVVIPYLTPKLAPPFRHNGSDTTYSNSI
jgi:hypothetical protein